MNILLEKKERTPKFSVPDLQLFADLFGEEKCLISKKTDLVSVHMKEAAWDRVTSRFNVAAQVCRTKTQLRYKYATMLKLAKKEIADEKADRRKTGGGSDRPEKRPPVENEWLRRIIPVTLEGLPAIDDDCSDSEVTQGQTLALQQEFTPLTETDATPLYYQPALSDEDIVITFETNPQCDAGSQPFDSTTPKTSLRQPVSSPLYVPKAKKREIATPQETRKKVCLLADAKTNLAERKVKHAEEEHALNLKLKLEKAAREEEEHKLKMNHMKNEEKRREELFEIDYLIKKAQYKLLTDG